MLSVCIPVYNFDVRETVNRLSEQLTLAKIDFEIVLIDDCSESVFKQLNTTLSSIECVIYTELDNNIGRSKIRNMLASKAKYEYILFLDCDVIIHKPDFIKYYINSIKEGHKVICGGREYPLNKPDKSQKLRWRYGHKYESKNAEYRSMNPSRSFMTNNFVIKREIFESIKFNEDLLKYGHEDTLFGYDLKKAGIIPYHINNPILNGDIEPTDEFLDKTRKGVENLALLYKDNIENKEFSESITLTSFYMKIKNKGLLKFAIKTISKIISPLFPKGISNPVLFNAYKLGYFISVVDKQD